MGIEPYCVKCRGRHFFSSPCVSNAPQYRRPDPMGLVDPSEPGGCSECELLQRRVAELEAKLDRFVAAKARRNLYQKNYMKKRRDVVALKLNTL